MPKHYHDPKSKDELERLLAKSQRRKAATTIAKAARARLAKRRTAAKRVKRIITKAEKQYAKPAKGPSSGKVMGFR